MKKGFTLIELMAIVLLMGVIALIIVPVIDNSIKEGKEDLYNSQIQTINVGLQNWAVDNKMILPDDGEVLTLTLQQLKQGNYVDVDMKNPLNKHLFPNDMLLEIKNIDGGYEYKVLDNTGTDKNIGDYNGFYNISLNGNNLIYVDLNAEFIDPGVILKDSNGNILDSSLVDVKVIGNGASVNTGLKGSEYHLLYKVVNGERISAIARTVIVKDMTPPVITVPNNTIVSVSNVSSFDYNSGVSAIDNSNEEIIPATNDRISSTPKTYTLKYEATDSSGNKTTKIRYVTVVSG